MRTVAHRGFAAVNPENTVPAVERAAGVADAVEVDVRRCGSGEVVVVHDETVDRVTDGTGAVSDLDLATLRGLSVEGSGAPIPTLGEVLAVVPADVSLFVELKEPDLAPAVLAACSGADCPVLVQSFLTTPLAATGEAAPDVPRSLLIGDTPEAGLERARTLDCTAVGVHHDLCSETVVDAAHDAGLAVHAWTVPDAATTRRLSAAGVDAVICDHPDVVPE